MTTIPASEKFEKIEFDNQSDWETYPTADFECDKCSQIVSINFKSLLKHNRSLYSNFDHGDMEHFQKYVQSTSIIDSKSFLDFYCPTCKRPVRIYYDTWAGGKHGQMGFKLRWVVQ